jgi:hypothetical protein
MGVDFFTEPRFSLCRDLAALGALYGGFALASQEHALPAVCPFRLLTGLKCPLCGLTTATGRLLQGDIRGAWKAHRLGPVALPGFALWVALLYHRDRHIQRVCIDKPGMPPAGTVWENRWSPRSEPA